MKSILIAMFLFAVLQIHLWFGDNGKLELRNLQQQWLALQQRNDATQQRADLLQQMIEQSKHDQDLIEFVARSELGYIKPGESYIQIFKFSEK